VVENGNFGDALEEGATPRRTRNMMSPGGYVDGALCGAGRGLDVLSVTGDGHLEGGQAKSAG
jgi:hypothetical protein